MASWQDNPGVKRVWLQDKHLSLMALKKEFGLVADTNMSPSKWCSYDIHNALFN